MGASSSSAKRRTVSRRSAIDSPNSKFSPFTRFSLGSVHGREGYREGVAGKKEIEIGPAKTGGGIWRCRMSRSAKKIHLRRWSRPEGSLPAPGPAGAVTKFTQMLVVFACGRGSLQPPAKQNRVAAVADFTRAV